jgi:hypothetical protein
MFIIRNDGERPEGLDLKLRRRTPTLVAKGATAVDWFTVGDPDAARRLGQNVVALHDGWYADDTGGGVAIFGPYWEIRDTHFTVREVAPDPAPVTPDEGQASEIVNVRKAIFGA